MVQTAIQYTSCPLPVTRSAKLQVNKRSHSPCSLTRWRPLSTVHASDKSGFWSSATIAMIPNFFFFLIAELLFLL